MTSRRQAAAQAEAAQLNQSANDRAELLLGTANDLNAKAAAADAAGDQAAAQQLRSAMANTMIELLGG